MSEIKEILAESYRNTVNAYFSTNKISLDKNLEKLSPSEQEEALYQMLGQYAAEKIEMIEKWSTTPLEELQGSTPDQVIQGLEELDQVFDIFAHMACFSDEEVPYGLIWKMKQFGRDAVSKLYQLALDSAEGDPPADYVFSAAVSALGAFEVDECIEPLIELAYHVEKEPQLELIEDALKRLGKRTIEPLVEKLTDTELGKVETMLIYVLACAGANAKDDRIYRLLRNAFRTMDNKIPAIICLSVYGDGRAVPMLRSFLDKYAHDVPDKVFHEIIGTIRQLGGETEDFLRSHHHH